MASLPLLEGVTIWLAVIFVLVSSFDQPVLSSPHMLCFVGWFFTHLVVMSWRTLKMSSNDRHSARIYRPGVDEGTWCCLLVPLSVLGGITKVYKTQENVHSLDAAALSSDLVFSLMSSTITTPSLKQPGLITLVWLLPLLTSLDPVTVTLMVVLCVVSHLAVCRIPIVLPKSFSVGEITTLVQLISLVAWRSISCLRHLLMGSYTDPPQDVSVVSVIGFFSAAIATMAALYFHDKRRPLVFFTTFLFVAVVLAFPALFLYLNTDPISWILVYIFTSQNRLFLLLYWLVCSLTAVAIVQMTNFSQRRNLLQQMQAGGQHINSTHKKPIPPRWPPATQNSSVVRKYFHVLALGVYVPGLVLDPGFLFIGSAVALVVLVLLEAVRVVKLAPLGRALDEAFCVFVDEKDAGKCILTHIYLLLGLSTPVWLSYTFTHRGSLLPMFSGVLSLAVGDTAASMGGSSFGRHRWPGTKKTIEGSLCCVVSQLVFLCLFTGFGVLSVPSVLHLMIAITLVSCYEAFTLQVDNLVLPLLSFALLSVL